MKHPRRRFPILLSTALSLAVFPTGKVAAGEPVSSAASAAATSEAPFLRCTLASLNAREQQRHAELIRHLRVSIAERRELPDGYAFRLNSGFPLAEAAEWIGLERRCCAFFGFSVEARPGEDDLWLHLTGGGDAKAFIQAVVLEENNPPAK